ncbi:hypothetical protein GLS40_02655 [Pseudooceanicola sp. 216_PA32_1]|uniref:Capsule polysaccharide biosynthesis protein n=1 Tax=Pseudooceanicola pacificus TaxID=2676438 RepID=A0A844WAV1_9RHOB|nr:hypothetical protein [Pseudooceanicola pacificus]MWB76922.1 hypothetical protein [Pseudooceanicola pacificus]
MSQDRIVRFHLDPDLLRSAAAGKHNFLNLIKGVVEDAGLSVQLVPNDPNTRRKAGRNGGYDLFHMDPPTHDRAVTIRRVYHYPFWAIEQSAERWTWHVARTDFPGAANRKEADRFVGFWRKRLFGAPEVTRDGHVYVPLQGLIRQHRSFQTCAPVEMIRAVLRHDPARRVVATLHPNETYDAADLAALDALQREFSRFSVDSGEMVAHLARCDYVVTQNSSAAFNGFFFGKPCVLFARIDFHHIAANVASLGQAGAFAAVQRMQPDYAGYLHWFWQQMSINAGRPEASERIAAALRRAGWPV